MIHISHCWLTSSLEFKRFPTLWKRLLPPSTPPQTEHLHNVTILNWKIPEGVSRYEENQIKWEPPVMTHSTYPSETTSSFGVEAVEGKEVNCHGCVKDVEQNWCSLGLRGHEKLQQQMNELHKNWFRTIVTSRYNTVLSIPRKFYCTHKFGFDAASHIAHSVSIFGHPQFSCYFFESITYSISDICVLCWECIGASIYGLGAGRSLPNLYQAHKLRSCYLSHLPSNTEGEHSTAPGSADRPGGNGVRLHTTTVGILLKFLLT